MKNCFLSLGICLVMLQVARPAQAQTLASAQTSSSEIQVEELQTAEPTPATSSILGVKAKGGGSGFEKGTFLLSPGISFGGYGASFTGYKGGFLPLSVSGEFSINDKFAVGAYVGFYSYSYYTNSKSNTSLAFGGKFVFHATGVFNNAFGWSIPEKVDLFATGYAGVRTGQPGYNIFTNDYSNRTIFQPGVTVGGRYFFTPNIGVFLELGVGMFGSGGTTGLSFKF